MGVLCLDVWGLRVALRVRIGDVSVAVYDEGVYIRGRRVQALPTVGQLHMESVQKGARNASMSRAAVYVRLRYVRTSVGSDPVAVSLILVEGERHCTAIGLAASLLQSVPLRQAGNGHPDGSFYPIPKRAHCAGWDAPPGSQTRTAHGRQAAT